MINYIASIVAATLAFVAITSPQVLAQPHNCGYLEQYAPPVTLFFIDNDKYRVWLDGEGWSASQDGFMRCSHRAVAVAAKSPLPMDENGKQQYNDMVICYLGNYPRLNAINYRMTHKVWKSLTIKQVQCDIILHESSPLK
jgi:hypothetical protein